MFDNICLYIHKIIFYRCSYYLYVSTEFLDIHCNNKFGDIKK